MSYGFFPEVFTPVEADIDTGMYKQAREKLASLIARHALSAQQRLYADILYADIESYTAHFHEALSRQQTILAIKPLPILLRASALMSHAYTVGYSGDISRSQKLFAKAEFLFKRKDCRVLMYRCRIGTCDVLFYAEYADRWNPVHNEPLLEQLKLLDSAIVHDIALPKGEQRALLSQVRFRMAILYWLSGQYVRARKLFAYCARYSAGYPAGTWACFGLAFCILQRRATPEERACVLAQLEQAQKKSAWKKLAKKYWPVALLIGETWRVLGYAGRTRKFYRAILKNEFEKFTRHVRLESDQALFMTRYFFPVYLYDLKDHIGTASPMECRYAIARAELFRARFLTEIYKRHHHNIRTPKGFAPNIRIDTINQTLRRRFRDVAVVYCFDFRDYGIILISRDLETCYERQIIDKKQYARVKRIVYSATQQEMTRMRILNRIFKPILTGVSARHVIVVPHGLFNDVPFHSLCVSDKPLARRCVVQYWPSLHMAAIDTTRFVKGRSILFIGTRTVPSSCCEIEEIIKAVRPKRYEVLFDPTVAQLRGALQARWALLHIVTHGSPAPGTTLLHFAGGAYDLREVLTEDISVPLVVVLNVCYGGVYAHTATDASQGMPVLLMQHGVRTVIAHNRQVPYEAALQFAIQFYKAFFIGLPVGNAYRQAILKNGIGTVVCHAPCLIGNALLRLNSSKK